MKTNVTISVDVTEIQLFKNKYFYSLSPFCNACIHKAVKDKTFFEKILKEFENEKRK